MDFYLEEHEYIRNNITFRVCMFEPQLYEICWTVDTKSYVRGAYHSLQAATDEIDYFCDRGEWPKQS